jgi:2'-5' RNA ligase
MVNTPKRPFSVWLTPCEKHAQELLATIRRLARQYNAPVFYPHVTITSGFSPDFESLRADIDAATAGVAPFSMRVDSLDCTEDLFKTLFVTFHASDRLQDLYGQVRERVEERAGYEFMPHLSLLYKDMPLQDKQRLAGATRIDMETIDFEGIWVTTPGSEQHGWKDVGRWGTVLTKKLMVTNR